MKTILKHLELPTMDKIITVRILRFLVEATVMRGDRLTREVLWSEVNPWVHLKTKAKSDVYEAVLRPPCTESHWITGLYLLPLMTVLSGRRCIDLETAMSGVTLTNNLE
jgi:hypothetical protein